MVLEHPIFSVSNYIWVVATQICFNVHPLGRFPIWRAYFLDGWEKIHQLEKKAVSFKGVFVGFSNPQASKKTPGEYRYLDPKKPYQTNTVLPQEVVGGLGNVFFFLEKVPTWMSQELSEWLVSVGCNLNIPHL